MALTEQHTALVFALRSIFLGLGDITCYQPQTVNYNY